VAAPKKNIVTTPGRDGGLRLEATVVVSSKQALTNVCRT